MHLAVQLAIIAGFMVTASFWRSLPPGRFNRKSTRRSNATCISTACGLPQRSASWRHTLSKTPMRVAAFKNPRMSRSS